MNQPKMFCILSIVVISGLAFSEANTYTKGLINPFLNQSSQGVYRFKGAAMNGVSFSSYWYQDDVEQKLALGIGRIGSPGFQAAFWFFKDIAYELSPSENAGAIDGVQCKKIIDFNYTMEIAGYDRRYLSSMGVFKMYEAKETTDVELFAGVALDGVGPLNVVAVADVNDGTYVKLYTIQSIGRAHYSEYYLYPRNDSRPAEWGGNQVFDLHASCKLPNVPEERFFDQFNLLGQRIDKKPPISAAVVNCRSVLLLSACLSWLAVVLAS